jgi:hypothetical protein
VIVIAAIVTGYWESNLTNEQYHRFLQMNISHP